jgi:hypothetical protein
MHHDIDSELARELKEIEAESIGWRPLVHGMYVHRGALAGDADELVIQVVGIADTSLAHLNAILLTG